MSPESIPDTDSLRMCIDCEKSRVYQASNNRTIWYFCVHHGVMTHYNESCTDYVRMSESVKETKPCKDFPNYGDWPAPAKHEPSHSNLG